MSHGLSDATLARIREVLAKFPEVNRAVLYGSRAKGNPRRGSDIDLALMGGGLTARLLGTIADRLDDLDLPYTIDLSHYDSLQNAALREHIDRVGLVLYAAKQPTPCARRHGSEGD